MAKSQVKPEELIVNELIEAIESGNTKLWRKEWTVKGGFRNLLTGMNIRVQILLFYASKLYKKLAFTTFYRCRSGEIPSVVYLKKVQNLLGFSNHF